MENIDLQQKKALIFW